MSTTIEKGLIQIFERKNQIIDHVKQQILLFDHHLASKCLIDGFVPPPWLLSSSPSGFLFPHPQPSIPYSSLYQQQPFVTTENVQLPNVLCSRVDASNDGLDQCLSGKGDELDPSVTSPPQDCRDEMVSDVCPDPGFSLVQRSKSRQRALELRNSAKACKNVESSEKNGDACSSQNKGSEIASLRFDPVDKLELIRSDDNVVSYEVEKEVRGQCSSKERSEKVYSGRVTRSRSSVQSSRSASGSSGAGNTSSVAEQDGMVLTESIGKSSQQTDVVYELLESKVVETVHNTVSCAVKNEERNQCQSKERGGEIYSGEVTRSRSSVQPSRSASGSSGAGNTSSVAKQDGTVLTESIGKSSQQPDVVYKLLESKVVEAVHNTVSCTVKNEERDQRQSKERGEEIYSGRITRSRSSVQPPNSVNSPPSAGKSFCVPKQDGIVLTESINKSRLQPDTAVELLQFVKPVDNVVTCVVEKEESGQCHSKERGANIYSGRITRARCPIQSPKSVNGLSCAGKTSEAAKHEGNMLIESTSKSKQQPTVVDELLALVKPAVISDETCDSRKAGDHRSKENESNSSEIESVLDHICAKSSDNKVAIQSIQPVRHSGSHVEDSWPHKRRKIDGQRSNSLSLSLSSKEADFMQLNTDKPLVDEENQKAGKCNWTERGSNENTPSTFMHKQFDVVSVSSLRQKTLEKFEDHSAEETGAVDPSSIMFGPTRKSTVDENQNLSNVGDKSEFGNIEHLVCDERSKQESKYQLGEDGEFSTSLIRSLCRPPTDLISADQSRSELEGFIIETDNEQICNGVEGINFEKLELPKTTIERASLLEQLCKSASIHTPLSQFPTTYRLHQVTDLYQSVPNGLLECMDLRSTLPENDVRKNQLKVSSSFFGEEMNHAFLGGCFSDCLPLSSSQVTGNVKKPYLSPVGKLWNRITSNSDSSEKRGSLNLELPCISEENENTEEVVDAFKVGTASEVVTCSTKREPLAEISECPNAPASVSGAEIFTFRDSLDSVNTTYSFTGTENGIEPKVGKHNARKRRDTYKLKENLSIVPGANGTKRASESLRNRFSKPKVSKKTSLRKGGSSVSQKESKDNNIVSNITSFIPIVQQKQAASIITGKRDVKVKALEAAEAVKKLAEKKENDRKMKKEALKLERARLEQENLRQLELEKRKKEEERKRKEADMATKKRQREEVERLEKERKRKRMEEVRRLQRAPEEKLCSKKDEKEKKCRSPGERAQTMKVPNDEGVKHEKMQKEIAGRNERKMSEMEFRTAVASTSDAVKASTAIEDYNAKVMSTADRATESDNQIADTSQEQSYDISPYKVSDDEDEEEEDDDEPNRKFIPSWASKNRVALVVTSQQQVDPEVIFPPQSFCSIAEVLLPRKLHQNRVS